MNQLKKYFTLTKLLLYGNKKRFEEKILNFYEEHKRTMESIIRSNELISNLGRNARYDCKGTGITYDLNEFLEDEKTKLLFISYPYKIKIDETINLLEGLIEKEDYNKYVSPLITCKA